MEKRQMVMAGQINGNKTKVFIVICDHNRIQHLSVVILNYDD